MLQSFLKNVYLPHTCVHKYAYILVQNYAFQSFNTPYDSKVSSYKRSHRRFDKNSSQDYRLHTREALKSKHRGVGGLFEAAQWSETVEERLSVARVFGRPGNNADISATYAEHQGTLVRNDCAEHAEETVLNPLHSFKDLPALDKRLADNLARLCYAATTPVQALALPAILNGNDVLALAQTGSGKTAAFLLPLLQHLLGRYPQQAMQLLRQHGGATQFPTGLILAPTRELVQQIAQEAYKLAYGTPARVVALFGGANPARQAQELARGAHIVAATPGRLLDFLDQELLSLRGCRHLVLDEADRCLDMGFEPQIRRVLSPDYGMPQEDRQTLLFSATFASDVRHLANEFLSAQHFQLTVGTPGEVPRTIQHEFIDLADSAREEGDGGSPSHQLRYQALCSLLADEGVLVCDKVSGARQAPAARILVFSQTKQQCDELEFKLRHSGFSAAAIHGGKSQRLRSEALFNFKHGRCPILIASDVAARGLDIPNVALVVNYEMPATIDAYTHRIGRTGRLGRQGRAVTLLSLSGADGTHLANCQDDLCSMLRTVDHPIPKVLAKRISPGAVTRARRGGGGGGVGHNRYQRRDEHGGHRRYQRRDEHGGYRHYQWRDERSGYGRGAYGSGQQRYSAPATKLGSRYFCSGQPLQQHSSGSARLVE